MFARTLLCLAASCLMGPAILAQGQLWIVDQAGGPGVDFTAIQPAIDAAGEGDTIVIHGSPAPYAGFTIDGKSLVVKEEVGHTVSCGGTSNVVNINGAQSVTLRGLLASHLRLMASSGTILLEEWGDHTSTIIKDSEVEVLACASAVLSRCNLRAYEPAASVPALLISGSTVHLYETGVTGNTPTSISAGKGGDGVVVVNSFLFASGSSFVGGQGTGASTSTCTGTPGAGGDGLVTSGSSSVYLLGTLLLPGFPGMSCEGGGSMGETWSGIPPILVAGHPRDYAISSLADGGSSASVTYDGEAGDVVFSLVALGADPLFLLDLAGTLVTAIPPILVPHGPAGASGDLAVTVPLPALPPGIEAFGVYVQGAAISAVGAAVLAAPSHLTIR